MRKIVLFQGDSITDASRMREVPGSLGTGYANYVAGELGMDAPYQYKFYNRGISGNRIVDLYARIKQDMINLKPDYMSILIGVNDVWHEYSYQNGVSAEKFEMVYDLLIRELKQELPDTNHPPWGSLKSWPSSPEPAPWCPSQALPIPWPPRPWSSRPRALSWVPASRCSPSQAR